jgi:hypothetical protein
VAAPAPDDVPTDFSSESVTPPEPPKDGEQLFERQIVAMGENFAKTLGNSERVQKWEKFQQYLDTLQVARDAGAV